MTPEQAKAICIEAHKGQWRSPTDIQAKDESYILEELKNVSLRYHEQTCLLSDGRQVIKLNGITYIQEPFSSHPIAVADMMTTDEEKVIAYLHDVIEDTNITYNELYKLGLNECDDDILNALKLLTKQPQQEYSLYIFNISCCRLARKVKIADMFHNLSTTPSEKQKAKYLKYMPILLNNL